MARLSPRSKRAVVALALIAVPVLIGDALVVRGNPAIATIGGILMLAGPLAGITLLVASMLMPRRRAR